MAWSRSSAVERCTLKKNSSFQKGLLVPRLGRVCLRSLPNNTRHSELSSEPGSPRASSTSTRIYPKAAHELLHRGPEEYVLALYKISIDVRPFLQSEREEERECLTFCVYVRSMVQVTTLTG